MANNIMDYRIRDITHDLYDVNFFGDIIHTLVTHDPTMVSQWLSEIQSDLPENRRLMIGLGVEWRPNFDGNTEDPVATLQLCVDRRCLIYQLIHSPSVPPPLVDFLSNQNYSFVGIGIKDDLEKLEEDYGFGFNANAVDLRKIAADTYQMQELKNSGLVNLARVVLGKEVNMPGRVTMSSWDRRWLKPEQVHYACVDAFVPFEIGRVLNAAG